jgi:hypothetical protein
VRRPGAAPCPGPVVLAPYEAALVRCG